MPNFGEIGTGTTNNRIINVSEDMYGEIGEVRFIANLNLKGGDGGVKEEAKKAEDKHSPWNMPSTTSKDSKSC